MISLTLIPLLASLLLVKAAPPDPTSGTRVGGFRPTGPNAAARAAGKLYFGTATNTDELQDDADYFAILNDNRMFGQLTPAKAMKWVRLPHVAAAGSVSPRADTTARH